MSRFVCLIFLCLCTAPGYAQITVNRSIFEFTPDKQIQDLDLLNTGNFRIFVDLSIDEVIDPHLETASRRSQDDPRTADFLVSPNKLVLAPGQRKRVRIVSRSAPEAVDQIYRLAVKPHVGKIEVDEVDRNRKRPAIKVLLGYNLLLMVRPSELESRVEVTRSTQSITFRNTGNTNVMLRKIQQCTASGEDCVDLPGNRLYAGETLSVELPKQGTAEQFPVEVWQNIGLDSERITY